MRREKFIIRDELRNKILIKGIMIFVIVYFLLLFSVRYLYTDTEIIINLSGLLGWVIVISYFTHSVKIQNQYSLCKMGRIYLTTLLLGFVAVFILIRIIYYFTDTSDYSFANKSTEGILIGYSYAITLRKYILGGAIGLLIGNIYSRK